MMRRNRRIRLTILTTLTALLVSALLFDALVYEPYNPVLVTCHVAIPHLPRKLDGYKIVQLSDLHRLKPSSDPLIIKAVNLANSSGADVAVLTGDFAGTNPTNYDPCLRLLSRLKTRQGSFAVLGNHDHWSNSDLVKEVIRKYGVRLLDNSSVKLDEGLYLVGIDDPWAGKPDISKAFKGVNSEDCMIMLDHSPLSLNSLKNRNGLLLTGHTHGGQVDIPFIPRNKLPGLLNFKYIKGWYHEGGVLMYVNRGVGMIPPFIRFRCRPEVTVFILHPTTKQHPFVMP